MYERHGLLEDASLDNLICPRTEDKEEELEEMRMAAVMARREVEVQQEHETALSIQRECFPLPPRVCDEELAGCDAQE